MSDYKAVKVNYKHVIGHYWPGRFGDLTDIVKRLNYKDIRPVVWNNSSYDLAGRLGDCDIIDSPNNPIHGRYLAALIYPEADYFIFQDDDLILPIETIDLLLLAAMTHPQYFHGIEGRHLDFSSSTPYTHALPDRLDKNGINPNDPPLGTDMLIRAYACHRALLGPGLAWILETGISPGRCETVLFTGGRSRLVPGTRWDTLPEHGIGLCYDGNHDKEIDEFIRVHMVGRFLEY